MTTTHDLSKLPRWAESRIRNLEAEVASLRAHVNGEDTPETDTYVDDLVGGQLRPLGAAPWLRFHLAPKPTDPGPRGLRSARRGTLDVSITERYGRRVLQVRTSEGGIVVRPTGGNEVTITTEDWV